MLNKNGIEHRYEEMKDSLQGFSSKEFFIFLFFLFVSAAFWFMSTMNDIYEEDYPIRIEIIDVPRDIVITESLPDTIRVTLQDKGYNLLKYAVDGSLTSIQLHFNTFASTNGKGSISAADVQKILHSRLAETTTITSVKSDKWDFYFNHGASKKVPVLIDGQLLPRRNYYVAHTMMQPDSVLVFAALAALDTITAVYTTPQTITDIHTSLSKKVQLQYLSGAKIVPDRVKMNIFSDQMTEVTVNVPVTAINVPDGMSLKTFPARMDITVAVGLKRSSSIRPEQFTIVADYGNIPQDPTQKLKVRIQKQPNGVIRSTLQTNVVDYVIEKF